MPMWTEHIRTLLLTFFYRQMPQLIERAMSISLSRRYTRSREEREEYVESDAHFLKFYSIWLDGLTLQNAQGDLLKTPPRTVPC